MKDTTSLKKLKRTIAPTKLVSLNSLQDHLRLPKVQILTTILITAPETAIFSAPQASTQLEELFFPSDTAKEIFNLDL